MGYIVRFLLPNFLIIFLLSCSCASKSVESINVDIKDVIKNPSAYDGRIISVNGILAVGFEHCAVWSSIKSYETQDMNNVIWIDYLDHRCTHPSLSYRKTEKVGPVIVTGRFNANNGGHLGIFEGAIEGAVIKNIDGSKLEEVNDVRLD